MLRYGTFYCTYTYAVFCEYMEIAFSQIFYYLCYSFSFTSLK